MDVKRRLDVLYSVMQSAEVTAGRPRTIHGQTVKQVRSRRMDDLHPIPQPRLPQSKLGGGEGIEGIYGSITASGMTKIFDCLHHNCGLGSNSTLVDIGAGLGRWGRAPSCCSAGPPPPPPGGQ